LTFNDIFNKLTAMYGDDPTAFIEKHCFKEWRCNEWQKRFLASRSQRIAIQSSRGTGKTEILSAYAIWWAMTKPETQIIICASTFDQLMSTFRDILVKQIKRSLPQLWNITYKKIRCANGSEIILTPWNANRTSSLSGKHKPNTLTVMDEAVDIDEAVYDAGEGTLNDPGSRMVAMSNPIRLGTYFHNVCTNPNTSWEVLKILAYDCPHIRREYIDGIIKMHGENSIKVKTEIFGEFPDQDSEGVFDLGLVRVLMTQAYTPFGDRVAGLDVAEMGGDDSVLSIIDHTGVVHVERWHEPDHAVLAQIVADKCRLWQCERIAVDGTGSGYGLAVMLGKMMQTRLVKMGEKASNPEKYLNVRAEAILRLAEWIVERNPSLSATEHQRLIEEMAVCHKEIVQGGKVKIGFKADMKKLLKRSPDSLDSLALCMLAPPKKEPQKVARLRVW
jgi:hypothetical protein